MELNTINDMQDCFRPILIKFIGGTDTGRIIPLPVTIIKRVKHQVRIEEFAAVIVGIHFQINQCNDIAHIDHTPILLVLPCRGC